VAIIPFTRAPVPVGGGPLRQGEGAVWAVSNSSKKRLRIDPARNAVVARLKLPPPEATAAGDGGVWLTYPSTNTVVRIDPATNHVVARIRVGLQPSGIALSPHAVWVADAGGRASPASIRRRTA